MNTKLYNKLGCVLGIIILINILVSSCVNLPFKYVFSGGRYRYWRFLEGKVLDTAYYFQYCRENDIPIDYAINDRNPRDEYSYFYIDKYGTFIKFYGHKQDLEEFNGDDYIYDPTWVQINDSLIRIGPFRFAIQSFTYNRILLKQLWDDNRVIRIDTLEAARNDDVPLKYRGYQHPKYTFKMPRTIYW